ncbi:hypothetical protein AXF42_Ash010461 [Apostasia shenzhenica]|uniref:Uncharacterized protein n=1 Tax=Apostasia shenzhenica TaxID=1088818 RepID=A0A2I0BE51_9ASPA|nr:hypothetical protein AXF42_Ash010461 [Apostasia shenzhenica]
MLTRSVEIIAEIIHQIFSNNFHKQQRWQTTKPFSLHPLHCSQAPPTSSYIFRPPAHRSQMKNLTPAHRQHAGSATPLPTAGMAFSIGISLPCSWNPSTSSAPPTYFPSMNNLGGIARKPRTLCNSSRNSTCIDTSLS